MDRIRCWKKATSVMFEALSGLYTRAVVDDTFERFRCYLALKGIQKSRKAVAIYQ